MKYFLDTEFIEGPQIQQFGWLFGKTKPTIDLISIGIVDEDNRTYYAINRNFNLAEAWNRWQPKIVSHDGTDEGVSTIKEYWLRENVLRPIFNQMVIWNDESDYTLFNRSRFTYKNFKRLLKRYGRDAKTIAWDIQNFVFPIGSATGLSYTNYVTKYGTPEFYGYYSDYDWVVFCWLYGTMIMLPKGYPMYCKDLKQMFDEKIEKLSNKDFFSHFHVEVPMTFKEKSDLVRVREDYPKQDNEHHALSDAKWNKQLYEFLINNLRGV